MKTNKNSKIHPWTITGLIDAEGSLGISIIRDNKRKLGFVITLFLEIGLNLRDKYLLQRIENTFKVGRIYYKPNDKTYRWKVSNIKEICDVIIPHLKKYHLITQKQADFLLFEKIVEIINSKKHLTVNGLQEIVSLKASLNYGIKNNLKLFFPNITAVSRPKVVVKQSINPYWLSGFIEGEACFFINIYKSFKSKQGLAIQLVFKITQHFRDIELLETIKDYFCCGRIEKRNIKACDFTVTSIKDLNDKIIPFFSKFPIQSSKALNYQDFYKVIEMMKAKDHLTKKGLNNIKAIKANMNTRRKNFI